MAADTFERRVFAAPPASDRDGRASAAFGVAEVYASQFQYVWRCLRSLGVHDDLLDDAVQDVFVVVQRKLERFDGRAQLRTWLYAIALRVARRYRERAAKDARKLVVGETAEGVRAEDAHGGTPALQSNELECGERLDLARRALEALDDDKREAFVLAYVEQMSAPEIAQITGLPVNTVYTRIRSARLAFGAQVARLESLSRWRSR